jgi:hypothetical protein
MIWTISTTETAGKFTVLEKQINATPTVYDRYDTASEAEAELATLNCDEAIVEAFDAWLHATADENDVAPSHVRSLILGDLSF